MSSVDLDVINTKKVSLISPVFFIAQLFNRATTSTISLICSLLDSTYSFIQHLSEIRYLDQQKLLRSIPAAITNCLTELKPGGIPQISAGERMRLLDDYLGSPSSSFPPSWEKETTSSSGSHARAVGHNNKPAKNNYHLGTLPCSFPPRWGKVRMGVGNYIRDEKSDNSKSSKTKSSSGPRARAKRSKTDKAKPKPKDDD